jgi:hypothetical protein
LFPGSKDPNPGPRTTQGGQGTPSALTGLAGHEQQAGGHEQDRRRCDHQRDQDVGGEPEPAAGSLSFTSLVWSSWLLGAGLGWSPGVWVGQSMVALPASPPSTVRPARGPGEGRRPRRPQRAETAPLAGQLATGRRRSRYGLFGGDSGCCVPSGGCVARLVEVDHRCRHRQATSAQMGQARAGYGAHAMELTASCQPPGVVGHPQGHDLAVTGQATPSRSAHCPAGLL